MKTVLNIIIILHISLRSFCCILAVMNNQYIILLLLLSLHCHYTMYVVMSTFTIILYLFDEAELGFSCPFRFKILS